MKLTLKIFLVFFGFFLNAFFVYGKYNETTILEKNDGKTSNTVFFTEKKYILQKVKKLWKIGYKNFEKSFLDNREFFLRQFTEKKYILQIVKKLWKIGYKNFEKSFLDNREIFLRQGKVDFPNCNIEYFTKKNIENIEKSKFEALAFCLGIAKQYSSKEILIKEKFKHKKQKFSLSCEANTLTDFVNFYRIKNGVKIVNENRLIKQIPIDNTKIKKKHGKIYRGNPKKGFLGKMNGFAMNPKFKNFENWGWGVHSQPLMKIINYYLGKFGLKGLQKSKLTEFDIIYSLATKKPIMMWYIFEGEPMSIEIITPENKKITLHKNQHVGLIVGAKVNKNMKILGIYYYDGLHYNKQFMKYSDFQKKTKKLSDFILVTYK